MPGASSDLPVAPSDHNFAPMWMDRCCLWRGINELIEPEPAIEAYDIINRLVLVNVRTGKIMGPL